MQWEYKIVALGLIVDATEQNQREKHQQILNDLGREEWEARRICRAKRYGSVNDDSVAGDYPPPMITGVAGSYFLRHRQNGGTGKPQKTRTHCSLRFPILLVALLFGVDHFVE